MKNLLVSKIISLISGLRVPVKIDLAQELEMIQSDRKQPGPSFTQSGNVNLKNLIGEELEKRRSGLVNYIKSKRVI